MKSVREDGMRRFLLKKGDRSTAGGTVIEGIESCTHHGTALTFVGAKVFCPACKTTGFIGAKGPRWRNLMMGKEQALEGDICVCGCDPHPMMIASQRDSFHRLTDDDLAAMGVNTPEQIVPTDESFDEQFQLIDTHTGNPLANTEYAIKRASGAVECGITDSDGLTHRLTKTDQAENVEIYCNGAEYA